MSSTRLPGKVLRKVQNKSILYHTWLRISASKLVDEVIVITSDHPSDDIINEHCKLNSMPVFRGSLLNLLRRHYDAALRFRADIILKIPSDCPLIDPQVIDGVVDHFLQSEVEYVSNLHPMSLPDGMDVEVFSRNALSKALNFARDKDDFEHTTTFMWNSDQFTSENILFNDFLEVKKDYRFTLDYEEDWFLIQKIYDNLYPQNPNFNLKDVLELMTNNSTLAETNKMHLGDIWYLK
jgi:spore coat polysaccharide biosynthesis protein SpsF